MTNKPIDRPPQEPPPDLIFRRRLSPAQAMRELWEAREMVRSLAERAFRIRYKQAVLGFAWAILTPLALMLVFTVVVARVVEIDTGGVPYPLFAYLGLLPWTFFSTSVTLGGNSLVANVPLLNKIYCPREVFPLASITVAIVDTLIASVVLAALFVVFGYVPSVMSIWVPLLTLVLLMFTVGVILFTSIVMVYLRDLRHTVPILLQVGLFATPVAYGIGLLPERFLALYSFFNPLVAVIDGYRGTILLGIPPDWNLLVPGAAGALTSLLLGIWIFKRLEGGIADVA